MSTFIDPDQDGRQIHYLIIPHVGENSILMQAVNDAWTLPFFYPEQHHYGMVEQVNNWVQEHYGLRVFTAKCLIDDYNTEKRRGQRVYLLENMDPDWEPQGDFAWLPVREVSLLKLTDNWLQTIVDDWYRWQLEKPPLRVPWSRRGWFHQVESWIELELERLLMPPKAPMKQHRAWVRSCVCRIETDRSKLFFKAVPSMFSYEPVITRVLASRYPGLAPEVLAVHVDNAWMLMRDLGGHRLAENEDIDVWEAALRAYSNLQVDLAQHTKTMVSLGVPDRNVDQLAMQIEYLLADLPEELLLDEEDELKGVSTQLRNMCYELLDHAIPQSLSHGDLWAGNIFLRDSGDFTFFDWSDSSVSHPFFDMPFFLANLTAKIEQVQGAYDRLLLAYLEPWMRYEPLDQLRHAFKIAEVLGPLHQAFIYHRVTVPGIEKRAHWEMGLMLPYFIRQALHALRNYHKK